MMTHPLQPKLPQLKLSGMLQILELRAAQAVERQLNPVEFLALLLDDELERRGQQRLARRLAYSGCDSLKTLAQFDFSAAPGVNARSSRILPPAPFSRGMRIFCCADQPGSGKVTWPTPWPLKR